MRIFPPEQIVDDIEGFSQKDIFKRAHIGESLTNLVTSVSQPMVIALDSEWGNGKTIFLKMWAGELRKLGVPVIFFDAFENDYIQDPFLAVSSEIVALAQSKKPSRTRKKIFKDRAFDLGKVLAKGAVKIGTKAATLGALDSSDLAEELGKAVASDVADEVSSASESAIEGLLAGAADRRKAVRAFRDELAQMPAMLSEKENPQPLVIIVDELDRCTPIFALQLLERLKHFFAVPNVHFVLGVHLRQLGNSVRAAYGSEIEAEVYLQKFIHLTLPLIDSYDYPSESFKQKYISYLTQAFQFPSQLSGSIDRIEEQLSFYARRSNASLRTIERIYSVIALALSTIKDPQVLIPPILVGLAILKICHPKAYIKAKQGNLRWDEVRSLLLLDEPVEDANTRDYWIDCWRYGVDTQLDRERIREHGGLVPFTLRGVISNRMKLVPFIATSQIDRFVKLA